MRTGGQIMIAASNGIIPLLIIITIGFAAPYLKMLKAVSYKDLSNLLFRWTFPLTMVYTIGRLEVNSGDILLVVTYSITCILMLPLCMAMARLVDSKDNFVPALAQLWSASTINNAIVVGVPITSAVFGIENGVRYCFLQVISASVLFPAYYFLWELHKAKLKAQNRLVPQRRLVESHPMDPLLMVPMTATNQPMGMNTVAMLDSVEASTTSLLPNDIESQECSKVSAPVRLNFRSILVTTFINTLKVPVVMATIGSIVYLLLSTFAYPPLRQLPTMINSALLLTASITSPLGAIMLGCFIAYIIQTSSELKDGDKVYTRRYLANEMLRFAIITVIKQFIVPFVFISICYALRIDTIPVMVSALSAASCSAIFSFAMSDHYSYHTLSVGICATLQILLMFIAVPMLYYTGVALFGEIN